MSDTMTEFWKQNIASLLRKVFFALGLILIRKGYLTQDTVDSLLRYEYLYYLAGFIMTVGSLFGQWMKIRFNDKALKEGIKAPAGTPVSVVKNEVLAKESLVTRL